MITLLVDGNELLLAKDKPADGIYKVIADLAKEKSK